MLKKKARQFYSRFSINFNGSQRGSMLTQERRQFSNVPDSSLVSFRPYADKHLFKNSWRCSFVIASLLHLRPAVPFHLRRKMTSTSTIGNGNEQYPKVEGNSKSLVLVIAGPTASGKSDVAAEICQKLRGLIVSADSVQAYKGVEIGANKPTKEEQARTPHLLVDIVSNPTETYNAASWTNDCLYVIRRFCEATFDSNDIHKTVISPIPHLDSEINLARNVKNYDKHDTILPVVVGGTMMYIQWLVHGRPDALQPTAVALQQAAEDVDRFAASEDWHGAVEHVKLKGSIYEQQVSKLSSLDWYRLRRILEVAYTNMDNDDSTAFNKLYSGVREGGILSNPDYDVRCFFLCPDDRMIHSRTIDKRCEEMIIRGLIKETTDLLLSNSLPEMASKAIGYRQTLDYIQRKNPQWNDETSFVDYVAKFTAATRQYSKKQMQWFRKDSNFYFVPVPITTVADKRERIATVVKEIVKLAQLTRTEYEIELSAPDGVSSTTRKENEQQGKFMKTYQFSVQQLTGAVLTSVTEDADTCSRRVGQSTEHFINANQTSIGRKRPMSTL